MAKILQDSCYQSLPPHSSESDAPHPVSRGLAVALVKVYAALFEHLGARSSATDSIVIGKGRAVEQCGFLLDVPGGLAFETLKMVILSS